MAGVCYWQASLLSGHSAPARTLLVVGATVLAVGAVAAILAGWTVRVMDRRQRQATAETAAAMRAETDGLGTELGRVGALLEQSSVRFGAALGAAARVQQVVERLAAAQEMVVREVAELHRRVEVAESASDHAVAERFVQLAQALVHQVASVEESMSKLAEVNRPASVDGIEGQDLGEDGEGDVVAMPNSRAFQLGREVERRRWERRNGESGA